MIVALHFRIGAEQQDHRRRGAVVTNGPLWEPGCGAPAACCRRWHGVPAAAGHFSSACAYPCDGAPIHAADAPACDRFLLAGASRAGRQARSRDEGRRETADQHVGMRDGINRKALARLDKAPYRFSPRARR
jgi:hypothetical protein